MEPRLKSSTKKADFPIDYIKLIKEVIAKNFRQASKTHDVNVVGHIYTEEIVLRIGFTEKGSIKPINFEASVDYSMKKKNIIEQIYVAVDALGSMIDQYFKADGDIELPKKWHEFKMEGNSVYLQTSTENPDLEAAADKLLNPDDDE